MFTIHEMFCVVILYITGTECYAAAMGIAMSGIAKQLSDENIT